MSDWDLICGDAWKVQLVNMAFFLGELGGALIFSWLAEEFGGSLPSQRHLLVNFETGSTPWMAPVLQHGTQQHCYFKRLHCQQKIWRGI